MRAAAAGDEYYHRIYEDARRALTDRIFDPADIDLLGSVGLRDDARGRGSWCAAGSAWSRSGAVLAGDDRESMSRSSCCEMLTAALPALAAADD